MPMLVLLLRGEDMRDAHAQRGGRHMAGERRELRAGSSFIRCHCVSADMRANGEWKAIEDSATHRAAVTNSRMPHGLSYVRYAVCRLRFARRHAGDRARRPFIRYAGRVPRAYDGA